MKRQFYYPQLDSIRGLSFLSIFIYHSIHPAFGDGFLSLFIKYLYHQLELAIDVFFVLSSFLLTRIGIVEYEKNGNFSFKNFFTRRALRIWPLYYLLMFFSFVLFPIFAESAGVSMSLPNYSFYLLFISNFYTIDHVFFLRILWTLSVEEQFYLLLGISLKFFARYLMKIFIVFIIVSIAFSIFYGGYFHSLTYFFDFAVGGIAAILFSKKNKYVWWLGNLVGWKKVVFYSFLLFQFFIFYIIETINNSNWDELINRYLFVVYIAFFIVEQLINKKRITIFEKNKALIFTGKISYGLYCFHGMAITGIAIGLKHFQLNISQYITALIVFFVNYACATISYTFWEKPFLKLKDNIRRI